MLCVRCRTMGFHPSKSPATRSMPFHRSVHPQGRTPLGSLLCASFVVGHATSDRALAFERIDASDQLADTLYFNADVVTMDKASTTAQAIGVKGETILAVGSNSQMARLIGDTTKLVNMKGATVLPGFIDPHSHFLGYAFLGDAKHFVDVSSVNLYFKPLPGDPRCVDPTDWKRCFIPVETQDDVVERIAAGTRKRGATAV